MSNRLHALAQDAGPGPAVSPEEGETTLAAWIKPAAQMDPAKGTGGDILRYGNRKFILTLADAPPYRLVARLNESKQVLSTGKQIESERWSHVALTVKPQEGKPYMRLFIDGRQVAESFGTK